MTRRLAASAAALAITAALLGGTITGAAAAPEPVVPRAMTTPSGFKRVDVPVRQKVTGLPSGVAGDKKVSALVELNGEPMALQRARVGPSFDERAARSRARTSQDRAERAVEAAGAQVYGRLGMAINALQVRVKVADLSKVAQAPGVRRVEVSRTLRVDNSASNAYTRVDRAWQSLGLTGKGQVVGIIDTGIDYTHADFGGPGAPAAYEGNDPHVIEPGTFPTAKVVGGYDLVGDAYDATSDDPTKSVPTPDPDPLDCNGHGTHVAGTAAGAGVTTDGETYAGPYDRSTTGADFDVQPGAAPEAQLRAYKVFGCEGSVTDDVVVAAIDRAVSDGVDVINMSLGSNFGTNDNGEAVAIANATAAGVLVVTSAGNAGANAYVVGGPSTANHALSVAATDDEFKDYPGARITGAASATGLVANGARFTAGLSGEVLDAGLGCKASDYAGATGKVVVTVRGDCSRAIRAQLGQQAGAVAVVMVNTGPTLPPYEGEIEGVTIPFIGVPSTAGPVLRAAAGSEVRLAPQRVVNPGYTKTADFSSNGPRVLDNAQKPDVSAPGVAIPSAGVGTGTGSATFSGTSMASPHVAGIAALVRQAHPDWEATEVKSVIMSTAAPSRVGGYDSRRNGTGEVDAYAATRAQTYSWTSSGLNSIRFGSNQLAAGRSERQVFHITNDSSRSVTYRLKAQFSGSKQGASVSVSPNKMTLKAGRSKTVAVTLRLSEADVRGLPGADASDQGALSTIRGRVVATSSSSSAKRPDLQTTFLFVPVPLSDVRASSTVERQGDGTFGPIALKNRGVHSGESTVFNWLLADPAGDAAPHMPDLTNVGVAVLPGQAGGSTAGDRLLLFSTSQASALSTQSLGETDVLLDVNGDGTADFAVVGVDAALVGLGQVGVLASALIDLRTQEIVDGYLASGPANGSTVQLPVLASSLGLTGSRTVGVSAASFAVSTGSGVDIVDGVATFDPFAPALGSGQQVTLKPGRSGSVPVAVDPDGFADQTHEGWLIVTPDDRAGLAETDRVRLDASEEPAAVAGSSRSTTALRRP